MRVINIVDRLDRVNFGIWNAAVSTARELKQQFAIDSEIWYPKSTEEAGAEELNGAFPRPLSLTGKEELAAKIAEARLAKRDDIIVTHGCWQYPTRWGKLLHEKGFLWMAVPHGMLEPWSISQKPVRKWLYLNLLEKRYLRRADKIRAVAKPEFDRLAGIFGRSVVWIPNGIEAQDESPPEEKELACLNFLFMGRLHHKKGIMPLLEGWVKSSLALRSDCSLKIAGPDDGELGKLRACLNRKGMAKNVEYLGPVYGLNKRKLLETSHFFILPSYSEGFPTSVLEAMHHGLIPLISKGCNFPEILESGLAIEVEPDPSIVADALDHAVTLGPDDLLLRRKRVSSFIYNNFTHRIIAQKQKEAYQKCQEKV